MWCILPAFGEESPPQTTLAAFISQPQSHLPLNYKARKQKGLLITSMKAKRPHLGQWAHFYFNYVCPILT